MNYMKIKVLKKLFNANGNSNFTECIFIKQSSFVLYSEFHHQTSYEYCSLHIFCFFLQAFLV